MRRFIIFIALIALGGVGLALYLFPSTPDVPEAADAPEKPVVRDLILGPKDGFVTSRACRGCHADEYSSWHDSFHRTMTQLATPAAMVPPIDDVTLSSRSRSYRFSREGDKFWVEMADPDWEHEQAEHGVDLTQILDPPVVKRQIAMLTGSHHYQTFWVHGRDGNALRQVPYIYLFEEQQWIPREDSFIQPPGEPRSFIIWNANCIQCHSVAGAPGYGELEGDIQSSVVELGIACESCHGPGAEHINAVRDRSSTGAGTGAGLGIINPARLSNERSADVCGQCHSYFLPKVNRDWWEHGYSRIFHAGDELEESRYLIRPEANANHPNVQHVIERMEGLHNLYWPDGSVRVGGREYLGLIQSPCYQQGEMSCLSCHSMHNYKSSSDQLAASLDENDACLQCHSSYRDQLEQHTHHAVGTSGSLCVNCHMPHTSYALFKGIRNHRITVPKVEASVEGHRPNACNLCHLDQTRHWTEERLSEWYGQPRVAVEPDCRNVADAILWALRGDAAQRAVAAWSMGWKPAQRASGTEWMVPVLAELMNDPYSAVRLMAYRSLRTIRGYENWKYDFLAPRDDRIRAQEELVKSWSDRATSTSRGDPQRLLLSPDGSFRKDIADRLLRDRDQRPIYISE